MFDRIAVVNRGEPALRLIRADRAWARSEEEGRRSRGEGVIVAQPDTGVARHRELDVVRRVASFDVLDGDDDADADQTQVLRRPDADAGPR